MVSHSTAVGLTLLSQVTSVQLHVYKGPSDYSVEGASHNQALETLAGGAGI
jgi:hypothetical protein